MRYIKFFSILTLIFCIVSVYQLPNFNDPAEDSLAGYEALPDYDLRELAEMEWKTGNEETAMMLLDYIIENKMGDMAASTTLRDKYANKIISDKTPLGRVKQFGIGALTGKVDSFESLAGSVSGDLVVYGDVRDIVKEIVFEDDPDDLIVLLSGLGVLTTIFPPARR